MVRWDTVVVSDPFYTVANTGIQIPNPAIYRVTVSGARELELRLDGKPVATGRHAIATLINIGARTTLEVSAQGGAPILIIERVKGV